MKTAVQTRLASVILPLLMAAGNTQAATSSSTYGMIVSTAEGVGAFNSTLSGTSVQTFDNLLGHHSNVVWEGVGTFDELNVIKADQYGGAPSAESPTGTPYAVEGIGKVGVTTLKLNQATSYFGLYWSAGDAANDMKFYNNGVLVADFTTANLMNLLPKSYYGNPIEDGWQSGKNKGEPYGFINFIGDANTSWDTIVFGNNHGSGFEADNYTVRANGWNPTADGGLPGDPMLYVQSTDGKQTVSQISDASVVGDKVSLSLFDPKTGKSSLVNFAPSAPAAPAPPLPIIAAFASVIGLKGLRRKKSA
ncbi:hypothetical protein JIN84_15215 [Luteolibacter yonseiensis]|uniref:PEP-CTERM sorting domain-containing protein n=1 Tax=Luteolibacter yonseiensis TaxID=1144680 RepID=A0A934R6P7_9BACT|nr:hypothetical protein [Luteolibacter yonseiensis]MBK1816973.1 hypothetical protein [Luteolibacter yonseiensis]